MQNKLKNDQIYYLAINEQNNDFRVYIGKCKLSENPKLNLKKSIRAINNSLGINTHNYEEFKIIMKSTNLNDLYDALLNKKPLFVNRQPSIFEGYLNYKIYGKKLNELYNDIYGGKQL